MSIKLKNLLPTSPRYSGVLLDEPSHNKLVELLKDSIPANWKIYAHHMTIDPFKLISSDLVGTKVNLKITEVGQSDKALAVKVVGYNGKTNNAFPHITVAVNVEGGGKPKDSNDITEWHGILSSLVLNGEIRNL